MPVVSNVSTVSTVHTVCTAVYIVYTVYMTTERGVGGAIAVAVRHSKFSAIVVGETPPFRV